MAASAHDNTILIQWHPQRRSATVTRKDSKKECVFTFKVEDFKVKGVISKEPEEGKFHLMSNNTRSFTFSIETSGGEKPIIKCVVTNLPGDISGKPSYKLMNNYIAITVKKAKQEEWEGQENWMFPPLPEMT